MMMMMMMMMTVTQFFLRKMDISEMYYFSNGNRVVTKRITRSAFVRRYFGQNPPSIIRFFYH